MIQATGNGYVPIDEPGVSSGRRRLRVSGSLLRFLGAGLAILAAIISWVIMAEKLQKVNEEYHKPYFITYWVHGFGYTILYIVWQLWLLLPRTMPCTRAGEGVWQGRSRQLVITSVVLAFVSYSSAYSWYYSLPRTNIPANTAIYQAACVWVFLLSIFLLRERVTVLKVSAVFVSVVGVVLVTVYSSSSSCNSHHKPASNSTSPVNSTTFSLSSLTDDPDPDHLAHHSPPELSHVHRGGSCTERSTFPGYIALLYSAISYAVFEVGYKKWGSEEGDPASIANSLRFLGYLGINTLVWLWPGFLILHYSGVETFEWPSYDIFILLVWNALLDIVFNAGLLISIALSSALFASVGTVLVIPAAVLVDWLLQGFLLQLAAALGILLIIIGFIGFVASEMVALKTKDKEGERLRSNGRHLQSSVRPYKEEVGGFWEEGEDGESDEEETRLLLRSRRRKQLRRTIFKYLF